jgi:hypothetical protein
MEFSLSIILQLITTLAIMAAGIFAGVQIILLKKQKTRDFAIQMLQSTQTPEFMAAVNILFNLPENLSREEIESFVGNKMNSVLVMFGAFEGIGYLVFRRDISLELVDNFFGGAIVLFWRKFSSYFIELRIKSKRENYGEWVEWLSDQLKKRGTKLQTKPAYIEYREWNE